MMVARTIIIPINQAGTETYVISLYADGNYRSSIGQTKNAARNDLLENRRTGTNRGRKTQTVRRFNTLRVKFAVIDKREEVTLNWLRPQCRKTSRC